jgi:hypothetical protein
MFAQEPPPDFDIWCRREPGELPELVAEMVSYMRLLKESVLRICSGQLEELDVEGILAFAERILPRAADLRVQASLDQRQRFQQLFFPDGIAFDGKGFVGSRVTAPAFSYLREIQSGNEGLVDLTGIEPVTS